MPIANGRLFQRNRPIADVQLARKTEPMKIALSGTLRNLSYKALAVFAGLSTFVAVPSVASACRVGGDDFIVRDSPTPPNAAPFTTIAHVRVVGRFPGDQPRSSYQSQRGARVGVATISSVLRGPVLPRRIPVYIAGLSSCSYFLRQPAGQIDQTGYVVGTLVRDGQGSYLALYEMNDVDHIWR